MKKVILLIGVLYLFSFCSTTKKFKYRSDLSVKTSLKSGFIKQFKDDVFYKCLQEGYGEDLSSKIFNLMKEKDLFSPSDDPNIEIDSIQSKLAKKIILNLSPPYLHTDDEKEIVGKNFIISTCLSYYESKELDSLANIEYEKHLKEEK